MTESSYSVVYSLGTINVVGSCKNNSIMTAYINRTSLQPCSMQIYGESSVISSFTFPQEVHGIFCGP